MLDFDVVVDHAPFQRAGAIQGVRGDDVAEMVRLHTLQQVANAAAFQLGKRPWFRRGRATRTFPGRRAGIEMDRSFCRWFARSGLSPSRGSSNLPQAEEVHLEQAGAFHVADCLICRSSSCPGLAAAARSRSRDGRRSRPARAATRLLHLLPYLFHPLKPAGSYYYRPLGRPVYRY